MTISFEYLLEANGLRKALQYSIDQDIALFKDLKGQATLKKNLLKITKVSKMYQYLFWMLGTTLVEQIIFHESRVQVNWITYLNMDSQLVMIPLTRHHYLVLEKNTCLNY